MPKNPPYKMQVDAPEEMRIAALRAIHGADRDEIAATLVDEDEHVYPGSWQAAGFDRGSAISEYLWCLEKTDHLYETEEA